MTREFAAPAVSRNATPTPAARATVERAAPRPIVVPGLARSALVVGATSDPAEAEAERIADVIVGLMRSPQPPAANEADDDTHPALSPLRRSAASMASAAGGSVDGDTAGAIGRLRGRGAPPPAGVLRAMESAFGTDLSDVRLHTGDESVQLNERIGARAFTAGSDIAFGARTPDLGSDAGRHLLAHELTHVLQNRGGDALRRLRRLPAAMVIRRLTDADGQEVTEARIAEATDVALLRGWAARSDGEWEDESLVEKINERIAVLEPAPVTGATPVTGTGATTGTVTPPEPTAEERAAAAFKKKVEDAGADLDNFHAETAQSIFDLGLSYKIINNFFVASKAAGQAAATTLTSITDASTSELAQKFGIVAHSEGATAARVAMLIALVASCEEDVPSSFGVDNLCALINAKVLVVKRTVYRKTKGTDTNGAFYRFEATGGHILGPIGAEWHVHYGIRDKAENPGFKHKSAGRVSDRVATTGAQNTKLKQAFGALWGVG